MPNTRRNYNRGLNKAQKKEVKKICQKPVEVKYSEIARQGISVSSSHTIFDESQISQGVEHNKRVGDAIKIKGIFVRGHILGADSTNVVRLTVIRYKPSGSPSSSEIFDDINIGANGAMFSPINHDYRKEFVVLHDRFYYTNTYHQQVPFTVNIKSQPMTHFNDTANSGQNKIYFIWSSDSVAATHPTVSYRGETRYTDQ